MVSIGITERRNPKVLNCHQSTMWTVEPCPLEAEKPTCMKSFNCLERSIWATRRGLGGLIGEYPIHTRIIFIASLYSIQTVIRLPLVKSIPLETTLTEAKDTPSLIYINGWHQYLDDSHWCQQAKGQNWYQIPQRWMNLPHLRPVLGDPYTRGGKNPH